MIVKDWMAEAAERVYVKACRALTEENVVFNVEVVKTTIAKHSPFKDGVAYMPVPRCETCGHFNVFKYISYDRRWCLSLAITPPADFGCVQWKEKVG